MPVIGYRVIIQKSHLSKKMNLQEAAVWVKDNLNQEIGANTLRKACASGRLRGVRKGEGRMHIRRTEWDITKDDLTNFIQEEYHPRPSRRNKQKEKLHIPNVIINNETKNNSKEVEKETDSGTGMFYRVVEHLYQKPLPIYGHKLEKYDTRIVKIKIRSKLKAEEIAQTLRIAAQANNLADQLQYEIENYYIRYKSKTD